MAGQQINDRNELDAQKTHKTLFRLGMLTELFTGVAAIFLTLAFYDLFRSVNTKLSMLVVILGGTLVFVQNLQLAQDETTSAVVVNLVDSSGQAFDVPAASCEPRSRLPRN